MSRWRLVVLAVAAVAAVSVLASTAWSAEGDPTVTVDKELTDPAAIACGETVEVEVTVTGKAGQTGDATDTMLVLDLSGSTGGSLTDLKNAARAFVQTLDIADGANDELGEGKGTLGLSNQVGVVIYPFPGGASTGAKTIQELTNSEEALLSAINGVSAGGGSPHDAGITEAQTQLVSSARKAMVLITDGRLNQVNGTTAANIAKNAPNNIRIVTVGVGNEDDAILKEWASGDPDYYHAAPAAAGVDIGADIVSDVGAAVAVPAEFELTETLGAKFEATAITDGTATISADKKKITLNDTLGEGETATFSYTATRNGDDVFSPAEEVVGTTTVDVTNGVDPSDTATTVTVLPCGGTFFKEAECTAGSSCGATGEQGGKTFTFTAPAQNAQVLLTGIGEQPKGVNLGDVCPGFGGITDGIQIDMRPLTTDGQFEVIIPAGQLTAAKKKWWQTDICLGTNLNFITKINSLANLRPGATQGSAGRFWGLLPSVPRYTKVNGKWVKGPWINSRRPHNGGAKIVFTVPFVPGAVGTNGEPAYDPRAYGAP